jgi:DNA-binding PadR family transcriptional regulator
MSNVLPEITHLQVLVLEAIREAEQAGRDVRDRLAAQGVRSSAPAFYQMMGRLEEAGLVDGCYAQQLINGQNVKERRYRITRRGERALAHTLAFYRHRGLALHEAKGSGV